MQDAEELALWLSEHVLPQGHPDEHVNAAAYQRLHDLGIEPPTPERLDRVLASASSAFEERFCTETVGRLSPVILGRLEALLSAATEGSETAESERSPRATESGSADHELGYECQASGGDVAELSVRCTRARLAEYNMETIASEFLLREEGLPPEDIFVPDEFWTHLIHRGIGEPIQACNYVITCRLEQTRIDLISHESHASSIAFSRGSLREIPLVSYWCHVPYSGPSLSYCSETAPL